MVQSPNGISSSNYLIEVLDPMDEVEEHTPRNTYDDLMCQRAICMTEVAMTYEGATSPEVKQELLSVIKKLNLSLRVPSTAEVVVIPGSKIVAKI